MFCFSIRLEDTSSDEVNNNVKTCFFQKRRNEDENDWLKKQTKQDKNDNWILKHENEIQTIIIV